MFTLTDENRVRLMDGNPLHRRQRRDPAIGLLENRLAEAHSLEYGLCGDPERVVGIGSEEYLLLLGHLAERNGVTLAQQASFAADEGRSMDLMYEHSVGLG